MTQARKALSLINVWEADRTGLVIRNQFYESVLEDLRGLGNANCDKKMHMCLCRAAVQQVCSALCKQDAFLYREHVL